MWDFMREFVKDQGLGGILLLLFVADKLGIFKKLLEWKRGSNSHRRKDDPPGENHFHARVESAARVAELNAGRLGQLENTMDKIMIPHVNESTEVRMNIGVIQNEMKNLKERQDKSDANIEKLFGYVSQIKDSFSNMQQAMIEMGYGKK